ncbi:MAG: hypothetical protein N2D54_07075 [Chloroflexota bacterium]
MPSISISTTPTIEWFPPTPTPTSIPTSSPIATPDLRPGVDEIIFEDDFSYAEFWSLFQGENKSAAIENGHLTLALSRPDSFLFSLRQRVILNNFYTEFTVTPSLCASGDEYGVMVRVLDTINYFRLGIDCNGHIGVDRMLKGIFYPILPKQIFAFSLGSAPVANRIGIWALGQELRFFLNDQFLFSITDNVFGAGTIGAYVRTGKNTPGISVSFSQLKVWNVK